MNHRDRNVHNAGFTMGGYSHGYKPKSQTLDGVKLTCWIIGVMAGLAMLGRLYNIC